MHIDSAHFEVLGSYAENDDDSDDESQRWRGTAWDVCTE